MKANVKRILGVSVALITAAILQFTVGHRFCEKRKADFEHSPCKKHDDKAHLSQFPTLLSAPPKPLYCSQF